MVKPQAWLLVKICSRY